MASVSVALTGYFDFGTGIVWVDTQNLGSTFSASGSDQELQQLILEYGGSNPGQVLISLTATNDRFTPEFEETGRLIFTSSDGMTLEVMIANADISEPYNWVPTNSAEVIAFANHIGTLANSDATLTLSDEPLIASAQIRADIESGVPVLTARVRSVTELVLSVLDTNGLDFDTLGLIEAGDTDIVWSRSPRPSVGDLLDGEMRLNSGSPDPNEPINRIRFRNASQNAPGGELITLNDNGPLSLGDYFRPGGSGHDLTFRIQTLEDEAVFTVAESFNRGGSGFVHFDVPAEHQALVAGIGDGDRFIFALYRVLPVPPVRIRSQIESGVPSLEARVRQVAAVVSEPHYLDDDGDDQTWNPNVAIPPITVPTASGFPVPTYEALGLPDGVTYDSNTRVISGTPTRLGAGVIIIRATNSEGSADWTLSYSTGGGAHYIASFEISEDDYSRILAHETADSSNVFQIVINRSRSHYSDVSPSIDLSKLKNYVQVYGAPDLEVYADRYDEMSLSDYEDPSGTIQGFLFAAARNYGRDGILGTPSVFISSEPTWTPDELRHAGDDSSDARATRLEVVSPGNVGASLPYVIFDEQGDDTFVYVSSTRPASGESLWVVAPSRDRVYGSDIDEDSIREFGQRAYVIIDNTIDNSTTADRRAETELRRFTRDIKKLVLTTTQDGFVVGTNVQVIAKAYDLDPMAIWYIETIVIRGLHGHLREYELSMRHIDTRAFTGVIPN